MKVSECMTRDVRTLAPDDTVSDAAKLMAECDLGAIPVSDGDRLVGMVTDRDIVVRGICAGKGPRTRLRDVMTPEIMYCFEDEDTQDVAQNMSEIQVRRLPVMNRDKRLVGIVAIGDLAQKEADGQVGRALSGISRRGGLHNQRQMAH